MKRRLRPALEIISDIAALGFDLRQHGAADIAEAVAFLRTVNPVLLEWLATVLARPASGSETPQ